MQLRHWNGSLLNIKTNHKSIFQFDKLTLRNVAVQSDRKLHLSYLLLVLVSD